MQTENTTHLPGSKSIYFAQLPQAAMMLLKFSPGMNSPLNGEKERVQLMAVGGGRWKNFQVGKLGGSHRMDTSLRYPFTCKNIICRPSHG
jgi:hypothetical protein